MRTVLLTAFVFAALLPPARAGEAPSEAQASREAFRVQIHRLLAAEDLRLEAWGAYLAGGLDDEDPILDDALVGLARRHGAHETPEARRTTKAALDALIRREATVPPANVHPLFPQHRVEAILLLARGGEDAVPYLLKTLDVPTADAVWMAAVGLLASARAPGLAAHLLRDLDLGITASVLSDRNALIGIGGGDGRGEEMPLGVQAASVLEGWPPFAYWSLSDRPRTGAQVVAAGEHPVYAQRAVAQGTAYVDTTTTALSRNAYRLIALAAILGYAVENFDLEEEETLTVYWEGDADYVEKIQAVWRRVKMLHGFTVDVLEEAGLLTAQEAEKIRPRIEVQGEWLALDGRERRLPEVPEPE